VNNLGGTRVSGGFVDLKEIPTSSNPAPGTGRLSVKDLVGVTTLFFGDSVGTETNLLLGGGAGGDIPDVLYDSTYTTTIIAPVSSATLDTFGSWLQYSADIGIGKKLLGIYIQNGGAALAALNNFELEIGEGAVSSEVAVSRVGGWGQAAEDGYVFTPLNRTLTNNARISVRVRDSESAVNNFVVYILVATA